MQVRRTRLQLSQKLWLSGVMNPIFLPVSPAHVTRRAARAFGQFGHGVVRPVLARASFSDQYWPRRSSFPYRPLASPRSRSGPCRVRHTTGTRVQFVLVKALQRHGVDLDPQPSRWAASTPRITWGRRPQRVMSANFFSSSVSSEIFTGAHRAANRSSAILLKLAAIGGQASVP